MPQPVTYVRVKDSDTKHEFDVPDSHPLIGNGLEFVKSDRFPPSPVARPAKHHIPATPPSRQSVPSGDAPNSTAEKEKSK